jgi:hypothetical protein
VTRRLVARSAAITFGSLAALTIAIAPASAAPTGLIEPSSPPVIARVAGPGNASAVSVVVGGFTAGRLAYIEQCDGVAPTASQWSPTSHCDLGSSPAAAIVSADGIASFPASERNRAFHPFVGESPQSIFNCTGAGVTAPHNDLPSYDDCKLRVSTNNSSVTSDQVFIALEFVRGASTSPTSPPAGAAATGHGGTTTTSTPAKGARATHAKPKTELNARSAEGSAVARLRAGTAACGAGCDGNASAVSSSAPGLLALGHDDVLTGYLVVACGLGLAAAAVWSRRRARRVDDRKTTGG